MIVGTLEVALRLDGCFSLKDKRRVLRSAIDRIRRDFRVSIAEVDDQDLWNAATLGVAAVSNDSVHAEALLHHVLDALDRNPDAAVESVRTEILRI